MFGLEVSLIWPV